MYLLPRATSPYVCLCLLCLTRVAHNSLATDKPVALEFPIELEFGSVGFCGGRKTGEPGEKPSLEQLKRAFFKMSYTDRDRLVPVFKLTSFAS